MSEAQLSESKLNLWRTLIALAHVDGNACKEERDFIHEGLKKIKASPAQMRVLEKDFVQIHSPDDFFEKITDPRDRAWLLYLAGLMFHRDDGFSDYEKLYYDKFQANHAKMVDLSVAVAEAKKIESSIGPLRVERGSRFFNAFLKAVDKIGS